MMGCFEGLAILLLITSFSNANKCLLDVPDVHRKQYLAISDLKIPNKTIPITLDVSPRITHQITSFIYKIYLEEELGYANVSIKEDSESFRPLPEIQNRMSGVDKSGDFNIIPEVIINTEVWIAPGNDSVSQFERRKIGQCGRIGPPGRFGWFIPKKLNPNKEEYWKTFTSPNTTNFALNQSEMSLLYRYTVDSNSRRYYCEEDFCLNSTYIPPACRNQTCAVLLAGYCSATKFVVTHIKNLKLLVQVVWVGPNLANVVSMLTNQLSNTGRSLVFLSFTPSAIVLPNDPNYTSVVFPPCEVFASDTGCNYDLHTLKKLYSTYLEEGAEHAFNV